MATAWSGTQCASACAVPLLGLRAPTGEMSSVALWIAAAVNDWQQQTEWWQCQLQRAAGLVRQQSVNCVECNAVCARLCCAVAWVTCVVWGNVLSGVPCMTGCGALRAPRNLHATHTTMSVRGTRQPPFPACDACYELKQTELPGLPWSLARGDYAYHLQDAVPSRFLAWTGGGMDWLRSHQLLRYLTTE